MVRGGRVTSESKILSKGADPLPVPGQEELPDWLSKLEKARQRRLCGWQQGGVTEPFNAFLPH